LLLLSDLLRSYGWAAALALLVVALLWRARLREPEFRYRRDRWLLKTPLIADLVRRLDVARFSDSLAAALAGGAPLLDGLRLSRAAIGNRCLQRSLDPAIETVREGGRLGEALRSNPGFPALAARMIEVGEESGNLTQSLQYVAEVYHREFETSVRRLLNVLEPALIIFIGSGIALVILSMVSAIQRLNTFPV
jgi:general secretion pathway protein F